MFHNINWVKKPYYESNNLKSINVDHSKNLLDIVLFVNKKKEYNYIIEGQCIKKIEFHIRYNKSTGKVVFFMITYSKENKEGLISFYLPKKYDKSLIEDFGSFTSKNRIPFNIEKKLNPLFIIIPAVVLIQIISLLLK